MGKFKDTIFQLARVRPRKLAPSEARAVDSDPVPHPVSEGTVESSITSQKPAVKDVETDKLELETKLASLRCDLHPLYLLRNVTIEVLLPGSTVVTKVKGSSCTKPWCNRHFIREFGYFLFTAGEEPDFGRKELTSKCGTHQSDYMAVAKVDGDFAWACLEFGCKNSVPYQEPLQDGKPLIIPVASGTTGPCRSAE